MYQPRDYTPAEETDITGTAPSTRRPNGFVRRALDFGIALVLLVLALPLLGAIAVMVGMDGGPVLFRHRRVGWKGQSFDCLKFRTMMLGAEACLKDYLRHHPEARLEWERDRKLSFDPRITPIGRFLRATSLDELPQLINALRGDMALVGPRPVTREELAHYGPAGVQYMSVLPGITGLWQVSGRNDTGYERRIAIDVDYVANRSALLDLRILLRTPAAVLSRKGAR